MPAGRPPKYETPEEMQRLVDLYFLACRVHQEPTNLALLVDLPEEDLLIINDIEDVFPTVCGLALCLDLTRQGLIDYAGRDEFIDTVKKAKHRVHSFLEQRLYSNSVAGVIFNLKNNFGWKDKTETDITAKVEYSDVTSEELDRKIMELQSGINNTAE